MDVGTDHFQFEPHLNLNCKAEEFTKEEFFSGVSELLIFNSVEEFWFLWVSKDKVVFVSEIWEYAKFIPMASKTMLRLQIINFIRSPLCVG